MRFALMHLDEVAREDEEVVVVVPGGPKTAFCVPLTALAAFLPLLAEASQTLPRPCCPACSAALPAGIEEPYVDTLWL